MPQKASSWRLLSVKQTVKTRSDARLDRRPHPLVHGFRRQSVRQTDDPGDEPSPQRPAGLASFRRRKVVQPSTDVDRKRPFTFVVHAGAGRLAEVTANKRAEPRKEHRQVGFQQFLRQNQYILCANLIGIKVDRAMIHQMLWLKERRERHRFMPCPDKTLKRLGAAAYYIFAP